MYQKLKSFRFIFFLFIFIFSINTIFGEPRIASAADIKGSNLIDKISKDYTKKFCNSIGFGLSKESAMNFSFSENKQIFKNRKGIQTINKELLAHEIADSVIDSCGYKLDLYEDKDIENFAKDYLSLDQESS